MTDTDKPHTPMTAREALEMAAKICADVWNDLNRPRRLLLPEQAWQEAAEQCEDRIRALASSLPQGEAGVPEGYVPVPSTLTTRLRAVMDMYRYGGQPHAHLWGYLLATSPCREGEAMTSSDEACKHNKAHKANVSVGYMEDSGRFTCDVRVECAECGRPFQFLGLPMGIDLAGGAFINADGQECRLAIAPVGTVPQPLDAGLVRGFRVRMPGDH